MDRDDTVAGEAAWHVTKALIAYMRAEGPLYVAADKVLQAASGDARPEAAALIKELREDLARLPYPEM